MRQVARATYVISLHLSLNISFDFNFDELTFRRIEVFSTFGRRPDKTLAVDWALKNYICLRFPRNDRGEVSSSTTMFCLFGDVLSSISTIWRFGFDVLSDRGTDIVFVQKNRLFDEISRLLFRWYCLFHEGSSLRSKNCLFDELMSSISTICLFGEVSSVITTNCISDEEFSSISTICLFCKLIYHLRNGELTYRRSVVFSFVDLSFRNVVFDFGEFDYSTMC